MLVTTTTLSMQVLGLCTWLRVHLKERILFVGLAVASYPGHVVGGKSGLVSTACACANNSGNFPRTSPNTDKLHMVVMRRNDQTRYTLAVWQLCLRGDCFSLFVVSIILLRLASYPGHVPSCQILLGSQQLLVSQSVSDYSSTDSTALRLAT